MVWYGGGVVVWLVTVAVMAVAAMAAVMCLSASVPSAVAFALMQWFGYLS